MPDRYEPRPLPEDVMDGPVPLWGVWRSSPSPDWVREPGPARTAQWFVSEALASEYARNLDRVRRP